MEGEMYMKKLLSLVLALLMLMLCPAMAENAVQMQTLTSPDGTYSFEVPQDFFTMDAQVLKTVFATKELQQALAQGLGLADASQLSVYFDQLQAANMMIVYSGDMVSNLNVQTTQATLTMDLVTALKAMLDSATTQQYLTMGIAETDIHLMDIQEIGGRSWYGTQIVMMGTNVQTMMTIENGVQYTMAFTDIDAAVMQHVLESFTVVAPAAQ